MSKWIEEFEKFQANNRARRQEQIDEEVAYIQDMDITLAATAMVEAEVSEEKIKELLIKYWDLRPSDARYFIEKALKRNM